MSTTKRGHRLSHCCDTCTGQRQGVHTLLIEAVKELDERYGGDAGKIIHGVACRLLADPDSVLTKHGLVEQGPPDSPRVKALAEGRRSAWEHAKCKWQPPTKKE